MFKRAKQLKARQQKAAALARSKKQNSVNRSSANNRINSRQDLRSHVQRENEPYG